MIRPGLGAAAAILALAAASASGAATRSPVYRFAQPAQPLPQALLAVSARSGAAIIAPAELTARFQAPGLSGALSLETALGRLLAGTDLTFHVDANGVVAIRRRPAEAALAHRPALPIAAPAAVVEEIPADLDTVTVVARPLGEPGLALKRAAAAQIDLLLEDDLQRVGSLGLGDALARLPGASASLEAGEARQMAIRGVGGRFTRVRINGMETLATFGSTNAGGGTNRGRAFDYNVFAADLFQQVRLQKTASADLDEGSLGASVDMRTRSPMDRAARSLALVVEQGFNSPSGKAGPRVSAVVSMHDAARRAGVLVSAAYSRRGLIEAGTSTGQWETGEAIFPGFGASTSGHALAELNAALHARIPRLERLEIDQSRLGLTATVEWRPDDRTQVAADLLYAELHSTRHEDLLESFTFRTAGACGSPAAPTCGLNAVTVTEATLARYGGRVPVLIAGRFDGVDLRSEARHDVLDTVFRQATLAATHRFDNDVKATVLLGFSRSDFSNPVQDTVYLEQDDVSGFAYDFRDPRRPKLVFGDADLTTPAAWRVSEFRSEPNWVDNSFKSASLDLEGAIGALAWRAGLQHKRYRTSAVTLRRGDGGVANVNSDLPDAVRALPIERFTRLIGQGERFGVDNPPAAWLITDVPAALDAFAQACAAAGCDVFQRRAAAGLTYDVVETTDAGYLQVARPARPGRRFWGEGGLRLVRTGEDAVGLGVDATAAVVPTRAAKTRWRALPSLNLAWSLGGNVIVRFGAARVIARPDLLSLRPGLALSTTGTKMVLAGNPDLRPTLARAVDLSLEWTPAAKTAVSIAVYHKAIDTTVQSTITRPMAFSANPFGLPDTVATIACGSAPGCAADLPIWQFTRPENSGPGKLRGVEAAFRAPLDHDWFVEGAAAYTRTAVKMFDTSGLLVTMQDALGAPRLAANLALAYRGRRLEARAAVNRRGPYVTAIPAPNGGDVDGVNGLTTVDASARLNLSQRLRLTFDAANLTGAVVRQYSDRTRIPTYQHRIGREFRVGLRFEL
jgi:TonB-dependent receptor